MRQKPRLPKDIELSETTGLCLNCKKKLTEHDKMGMFLCLWSLNKLIRDYRYYKKMING